MAVPKLHDWDTRSPWMVGEGSFSMSRASAIAFKAMADLVKSVDGLVSTGFGELLALAPDLPTCIPWRTGMWGRPSHPTYRRAGIAL